MFSYDIIKTLYILGLIIFFAWFLFGKCLGCSQGLLLLHCMFAAPLVYKPVWYTAPGIWDLSLDMYISLLCIYYASIVNKHLCAVPQSPHRISAGGSLLFMRCVSLTLTGLVSAWRRGETPSAILAKPLSDCATALCLRQCKSRHLNVFEISKKIHAIFKQIEYLVFWTEVCVVMLIVTPATRVVVVRFFF